jgi:hypothetical protein
MEAVNLLKLAQNRLYRYSAIAHANWEIYCVNGIVYTMNGGLFADLELDKMYLVPELRLISIQERAYSFLFKDDQIEEVLKIMRPLRDY